MASSRHLGNVELAAQCAAAEAGGAHGRGGSAVGRVDLGRVRSHTAEPGQHPRPHPRLRRGGAGRRGPCHYPVAPARVASARHGAAPLLPCRRRHGRGLLGVRLRGGRAARGARGDVGARGAALRAVARRRRVRPVLHASHDAVGGLRRSRRRARHDVRRPVRQPVVGPRRGVGGAVGAGRGPTARLRLRHPGADPRRSLRFDGSAGDRGAAGGAPRREGGGRLAADLGGPRGEARGGATERRAAARGRGGLRARRQRRLRLAASAAALSPLPRAPDSAAQAAVPATRALGAIEARHCARVARAAQRVLRLAGRALRSGRRRDAAQLLPRAEPRLLRCRRLPFPVPSPNLPRTFPEWAHTLPRAEPRLLRRRRPAAALLQPRRRRPRRPAAAPDGGGPQGLRARLLVRSPAARLRRGGRDHHAPRDPTAPRRRRQRRRRPSNGPARAHGA